MTRPGDNQAVAFHDQLAERWEMKYSRASFGRRAQAILTMPAGDAAAGEQWLDAGCGTGTIARQLARLGCQVTAVDGSARMIEVARQAAAREECLPAIRFLKVGDIVDLPFADATFDGVVCSSVLEYLDAPARTLSELARVLRSEGRLIASVPNQRAVLRRLLKLAHWATRRCGLQPWPRYLSLSRHEFTPPSFARLLAESRLRSSAWRYYGPLLPRAFADTRYGGTLLMAVCVKVPP